MRTFAQWTALSALRSGAPIKSREDVYGALRKVDFDAVLLGDAPIDRAEFDAWHETETRGLCDREPRLCTGWAVKLLNVYLKTAAYVGGLGRPGLPAAIHPPIDRGLQAGIKKRFAGHSLKARTSVILPISDIQKYEVYQATIETYRDVARELGCMLIEVEQLWDSGDAPDTTSSQQS